MKVIPWRLGTIGRCACGQIGERRPTFSGEPICSACVKSRTGRLLTIRDSISAERVIGRLTPAQRRARLAWLRSDRWATLRSHAEEGQRGYEERTAYGSDGRKL